MRRAEVGLVAFQLRLGGQDALQLKIYRDGTLIRLGGGGLPSLGIGAVSYWPDNGFFERIMEKVPPQLLLHDIDFAEENISQQVIFEVAFSGSSLNGMIGEQAIWANHKVIRFKLDLDTKFRSPVLAFVDSLMKDAIGFTNSWYFDAIILAVFDRRSNRLPRQTLIAKPDSDSELKTELANFLAQMLQSTRKWNFLLFPEGKIFTDEDGVAHKLIFKIEGGRFSHIWT